VNLLQSPLEVSSQNDAEPLKLKSSVTGPFDIFVMRYLLGGFARFRVDVDIESSILLLFVWPGADMVHLSHGTTHLLPRTFSCPAYTAQSCVTAVVTSANVARVSSQRRLQSPNGERKLPEYIITQSPRSLHSLSRIFASMPISSHVKLKERSDGAQPSTRFSKGPDRSQ
jgi:hypothetical protein